MDNSNYIHGKLWDVHDDVIKWKNFPHYWPFVRGIHRSLVNSPHKDQWRGALLFSLICVWINGRVNNHEAGDLGRYRAHYYVIVMNYLTWSAPSYNQNQCWNIVYSHLRNKFQWHLYRKSNIFIQENALENVVYEMASNLSWPHCVKTIISVSNDHSLDALHDQYNDAFGFLPIMTAFYPIYQINGEW